jgi:hypothetical protein
MGSEDQSKEVKRDSEDDTTLRMLNAKKMLELRRRASAASSRVPSTPNKASKILSDRELLVKTLVERGDEVLLSAETSYPSEMKLLIPKLADLIRDGKVTTISGGELLQFLRAIGLRVSVPTSITVEDHGKFVSLSDKIREKNQT